MSNRTAQLIVFATSAAVLVIEILAGRLLAPYVGVSLETFTGIIGVILAGIALGNSVGGSLADKYPPARLIGPAVALGGVLTWASLPLVSLVGPGSSADAVGIMVLSFVAFFAPAAALSTISPMVAKLAVLDLERTGAVVGGLSAAGTLGALTGTFVTGFVLVSRVPTRPMIVVVGAALVIGGLLLSWKLRGTAAVPAGAAIVGLVLLGAAVVSGDPCEFESAYTCGAIVVDDEDPSVRVLELDGVRHSSVDLDDPTNLGFRYIRILAAVTDAVPAGPIDALHIGGGGFTMPRYVEATRPGSDSLVLEIDPKLVDVAREQLGFETNERLRVQTGDARLALNDIETDSVDLVIGDAFSGASVPWHLTTSEVLAEIDRMLRPGGFYAMNVIDGGPNRFARASMATFARHFDHLAVVLPRDGVEGFARNQILVGSDAPLPEILVDSEDGFVETDIVTFIDGQRHLTDDFAPADQLASR